MLGGSAASISLGILLLAQVPSSTTGYGWTRKPWGNSSAFYATRAKVEAEFARKPDPATFVARWRSIGRNASLPLATRFGYVEALVIVYAAQGMHRGFDKDAKRALQMVAASDMPANFETARARYLLEASVWSAPDPWPVVKRLLARDPKDVDVRYYGSGDLAWGAPDLKTRLEGLAMARDLARLADRYPRRLRALAAANEGVYNLNKDPARLNEAITTWRLLLTKLPADHPNRKQIEATIRFLEKQRNTSTATP